MLICKQSMIKVFLNAILHTTNLCILVIFDKGGMGCGYFVHAATLFVIILLVYH